MLSLPSPIPTPLLANLPLLEAMLQVVFWQLIHEHVNKWVLRFKKGNLEKCINFFVIFLLNCIG